MSIEVVAAIAEKVYFKVVETLDMEQKCIENDPDNEGGTRNTEQGAALYFSIESAIQDAMEVQSE